MGVRNSQLQVVGAVAASELVAGREARAHGALEFRLRFRRSRRSMSRSATCSVFGDRRDRRALRAYAVHRVVRELVAFADRSGRAPPPRGLTEHDTVRKFATDWEAGLESWESIRVGGNVSRPHTGARYVAVVVAKHADGYCLWPTGVAGLLTPHVGIPAATWSESSPKRARRGHGARHRLLRRLRLEFRGPADRFDGRRRRGHPAATIPVRRCPGA